MPDLEQAIRERAYHMWMAEGCPQGRCDIFWLNAERHLLADHMAPAISTTVTSAPKKLATKKNMSAKKKRAA